MSNDPHATLTNLIIRTDKAIQLGDWLVNLSADTLRKNWDKAVALGKEHDAIPAATVALEGFPSLDAEAVLPPSVEMGDGEWITHAKAGLRTMVRNLTRVHTALLTYRAQLEEDEPQPPPREEPGATTPPPPPPGANAANPGSPPPPAAKEEEWTWWEKLGCGCLGILTIPVAFIFMILWIGSSEESDTLPPAPQPVAEEVAPAPAPTPSTAAATGELDCSLAFSMSSDMDGDGKDELHAVIPVHGGATTLLIEGWSVTDDGKCRSGGGHIMGNGHLEGIRKGLKKALGLSKLPTEGMTDPVKVNGRTVMCNIGSGTAANCFEG